MTKESYQLYNIEDFSELNDLKNDNKSRNKGGYYIHNKNQERWYIKDSSLFDITTAYLFFALNEESSLISEIALILDPQNNKLKLGSKYIENNKEDNFFDITEIIDNESLIKSIATKFAFCDFDLTVRTSAEDVTPSNFILYKDLNGDLMCKMIDLDQSFKIKNNFFGQILRLINLGYNYKNFLASKFLNELNNITQYFNNKANKQLILTTIIKVQNFILESLKILNDNISIERIENYKINIEELLLLNLDFLDNKFLEINEDLIITQEQISNEWILLNNEPTNIILKFFEDSKSISKEFEQKLNKYLLQINISEVDNIIATKILLYLKIISYLHKQENYESEYFVYHYKIKQFTVDNLNYFNSEFFQKFNDIFSKILLVQNIKDIINSDLNFLKDNFTENLYKRLKYKFTELEIFINILSNLSYINNSEIFSLILNIYSSYFDQDILLDNKKMLDHYTEYLNSNSISPYLFIFNKINLIALKHNLPFSLHDINKNIEAKKEFKKEILDNNNNIISLLKDGAIKSKNIMTLSQVIDFLLINNAINKKWRFPEIITNSFLDEHELMNIIASYWEEYYKKEYDELKKIFNDEIISLINNSKNFQKRYGTFISTSLNLSGIKDQYIQDEITRRRERSNSFSNIFHGLKDSLRYSLPSLTTGKQDTTTHDTQDNKTTINTSNTSPIIDKTQYPILATKIYNNSNIPTLPLHNVSSNPVLNTSRKHTPKFSKISPKKSKTDLSTPRKDEHTPKSSKNSPKKSETDLSTAKKDEQTEVNTRTSKGVGQSIKEFFKSSSPRDKNKNTSIYILPKRSSSTSSVPEELRKDKVKSSSSNNNFKKKNYATTPLMNLNNHGEDNQNQHTNKINNKPKKEKKYYTKSQSFSSISNISVTLSPTTTRRESEYNYAISTSTSTSTNTSTLSSPKTDDGKNNVIYKEKKSNFVNTISSIPDNTKEQPKEKNKSPKQLRFEGELPPKELNTIKENTLSLAKKYAIEKSLTSDAESTIRNETRLSILDVESTIKNETRLSFTSSFTQIFKRRKSNPERNSEKGI